MKGHFGLLVLSATLLLLASTGSLPAQEPRFETGTGRNLLASGTDSGCGSSTPIPAPLILVVDGAGDLKGCSNALKSAAAQYQIPLIVDTFPWSHGYYRLYQDQVDAKHFRAKGKELAEHIANIKAKQPERQITLVSHSAGCSVALAACAYLPADALERQILLAPSVSTRYDLRPALHASKQGIDVFCSKKDRWALRLVIRWIGSADELHDSKAAGRYGFELITTRPGDMALYQRLRQHFWSKADEKLGNDGRHHGMHAPAFVRERIFALWLPETRAPKP